jgi:molecular chaperone GrpE
MKTKKTTQKVDTRIQELEEEVKLAQETTKRSLADYQNLLRRTQEDRLKSIQMANQGLMEELVQPLEHLEMAAAQLNDPGLNMVLSQLKNVLENAGLEEIQAIGKKFDVELMEAVDKAGDGDTVVKVTQKGYMLNGVVIRHAKVVLE